MFYGHLRNIYSAANAADKHKRIFMIFIIIMMLSQATLNSAATEPASLIQRFFSCRTKKTITRPLTLPELERYYRSELLTGDAWYEAIESDISYETEERYLSKEDVLFLGRTIQGLLPLALKEHKRASAHITVFSARLLRIKEKIFQKERKEIVTSEDMALTISEKAFEKGIFSLTEKEVMNLSLILISLAPDLTKEEREYLRGTIIRSYYKYRKSWLEIIFPPLFKCICCCSR